jgi:hypothetical protein
LIICDEVGFAPLDTPAPNCCSASSPPPTNAEHSASPATGPSSPEAGSCPNTPPQSACSTGCCTTPTSSLPTASPTACARPERTEAPPRRSADQPGGDLRWPPAGTTTWPLTPLQAHDGRP